MRASKWEYRLRYPLHMLVFVLGLWPFWEPGLGLIAKSTWLEASAAMGRQGWLNFGAATVVLLLAGAVFTALGAWFRVWGTAYIGTNVVNSPGMHEARLLVDGPFRHTRNPLYLGTLLHTIGLAILMPPAGAIFTIVVIALMQVRLAGAEEVSLTQRFGQPYAEYVERVPRFLPSPKPMMPRGGVRPHWLQAMLGESYFVGVAITLIAFGWDFNALPLYKGILISFGVALVLRALLPGVKTKTADATI